MSTRRGNDEAPVSLFSFQDIITSVAGILIFLVLMFTLHMARKTAVHSRTPPGEPTVALDRFPDRTRMIHGLLAYLDNLKLKKVSGERLQHEREADLAKISRLKGELDILYQSIANLTTNIAAVASSYSNNVQMIEEQELYAQIGKGAREPVVVFCTGNEILCGKLGATPQRFTGDSKETAFLGFASRTASRENHSHFLFLFTPSSAPYSWPLVKTVEGNGSPVGWQPWPEAKPFRFQKGKP